MKQCLEKLIASIKELKCLENDFPSGYGFAVRKGLSSFSGDYVAIVMADMDCSNTEENLSPLGIPPIAE